MGKAWFTDYPHISIEFEDLKIIDKIDERKPFRVIIKPEKKYIENHIVGFDTIPSKTIVKSNYENLKNEYLRIDDENGNVIEELNQESILQSEEEYIPNWISMRTGKENYVKLKLDWKPDDWWVLNRSGEERSKEYDCIGFEPHEDFLIEPLNLKDKNGDLIDNVTIKCKNNNKNPTMLKIVTDNNKIIGAINIFYPKPKKVKIKWITVNFNEGDKDLFEREYKNKDKIKKYLEKGLNPALIDVEIVNIRPILIDLTTIKPSNIDFKKIKKSMKGNSTVKSSTNDETIFLKKLEKIIRNKISPPNDEVLLLLTNLKCFNSITEDETEYINGISFTKKGISCIFLKNERVQTEVEIPHEIMHAIALKHTFKEKRRKKHEINRTRTNNYMDYDNAKKGLFKWQWSKLHKSPYTK